MNNKKMGFETRLVHSGELPLVERAVTLPIFQTSTFQYEGEDNYHDVRYLRLNNNPNQVAVSNKIADLENAPKALVTASGMAAISTTLLALVEHGEHVLAQEDLYGGTRYFLEGYFVRMGRSASYFPLGGTSSIESRFTPQTRLLYMESISNPTMRVGDMAKAVAAAKSRGILTVIDNTFCSPVNFRPMDLGFDVVLHSATKYLNGHSDIVAGAVAGKAEPVQKILRTLNLLGAALDPHACFLLHRGMKTLGLRVRRQNETALALAQFLSAHPRVRQVNYPGLETSAGHRFAKEWFQGFGGMLSFVLDASAAQTDHFLSQLTIPFKAPSLGGLESLITRPAATSHAGLSKAVRDSQGIVDSLVRVSVGIEDFDDLASDFKQALGALS
jgi:cystathionine beta-lyase/cystathionine gamma-synthase